MGDIYVALPFFMVFIKALILFRSLSFLTPLFNLGQP